jgi:SAM-dependent methyltransferase
LPLLEDAYGCLKRFEFVEETIGALRPDRILDVGCGTGTQLTRPLAQAHPEIAVLGIDGDEASVAWARSQPALRNLRFATPAAVETGERFPLVIASEVLEHVDAPAEFLVGLTKRVAPNGRLIVTVPNGYGPFEAMALIEALLSLSGLQAVLRHLKGGQAAAGASPAATLAVSPHLNFFSLGELDLLFGDAGMTVRREQARTVFCGYLIDNFVRGDRLPRWNARLADRLPRWCASDWMFELAPAAVARPSSWRRGRYARWRKRLNERRWALA